MTQLHLKHYIYILVSLSALLFFVFGFTIHTKLLSLDDYISYTSLEAAHSEFDNAIDNLKIRIDTLPTGMKCISRFETRNIMTTGKHNA